MNEKLWSLLPHAAIIMALFLGTLWVLNQLNPLMGFMENTIAESVQILFCFTVLVNGVRQIWLQYFPE